jgi:FMN phosphatase YigB (HAD superfamily)
MDEETKRFAEGVTHLTFDCYGTLIDWEQGILRAVRSVCGAEQPDEKSVLQSYVRHEARLDLGPAFAEALAPTGVADYLSGLLLGAEIAAARAWLAAQRLERTAVMLLGEPALLVRYRRALTLAEIDSVLGPSDAAARGLWRIARHAGMLTDG